jgi:hypothetical protein
MLSHADNRYGPVVYYITGASPYGQSEKKKRQGTAKESVFSWSINQALQPENQHRQRDSVRNNLLEKIKKRGVIH